MVYGVAERYGFPSIRLVDSQFEKSVFIPFICLKFSRNPDLKFVASFSTLHRSFVLQNTQVIFLIYLSFSAL
jgi:hypothetical protein